MKYLNEIKEGENVLEIYFCKEKQTAVTKSGKTYYSLTLQDKTSLINAKIWDITPNIGEFEVGDYIYIMGTASSYQNAIQLSITKLRRAAEHEYDISNYMPVTKYDRKEMYKEVVALISTIKDVYLNTLLRKFFIDDKELVKKIVEHSAAKSVHHGFIGGLLQHSLSVAKACDYMAKAYPLINRDLLITAALFHDIGKLEELETFPINDYSEMGNYLGHIYMGAEKVGYVIKEIPGFPKETELKLKHCILAHHGELEFGSPKKPAIIEAVALNFADDMDAKLEAFTEILDNANKNDTWLGYNKIFGSNIRNI